jgi:hypothetical protein
VSKRTAPNNLAPRAILTGCRCIIANSRDAYAPSAES